MSVYNPNTDSRFQPTFDEQFIDLLDKHGFPIVEEQPKNVHKIAEALGESLNYYVAQGKELFLQGRLATAQGADLDRFGIQFGVPRNIGESDDLYRIRLQALFSPKKVTRPHIEQAINSFIQTNPRITLLEPWRQVLKFDNVDPSPRGCFDIGDSYMWSPDYWRSGVLVVRSGLSSQLYGTVESLVAMGVLVLYDQYSYELIGGEGIKLGSLSYQDAHTSSFSPIANTLYFDLVIEGTFDSIYQLDTNDFFEGLAAVDEHTSSIVDFVLRCCPEEDTSLNPGQIAVRDNPWFQFDIVDPGVVVGNQNEFNIDFFNSGSFDINPELTAFDTNEFTIYNDLNVMDSEVVVITGGERVRLCNVLSSFATTASLRELELIVDAYPGDWLNYSTDEDIVDRLILTDGTQVNFQGQSEQSTGEILIFHDAVGMEWKESPIVDAFTLLSQNFVIFTITHPPFTDTVTFTDSLQEGSDLIPLANPMNYKLGDNKKLATLDTISLNNPYTRTLGDFRLRSSNTVYTTLSNPTGAKLEQFALGPNEHYLSESDTLGQWMLVDPQ